MKVRKGKSTVKRAKYKRRKRKQKGRSKSQTQNTNQLYPPLSKLNPGKVHPNLDSAPPPPYNPLAETLRQQPPQQQAQAAASAPAVTSQSTPPPRTPLSLRQVSSSSTLLSNLSPPVSPMTLVQLSPAHTRTGQPYQRPDAPDTTLNLPMVEVAGNQGLALVFCPWSETDMYDAMSRLPPPEKNSSQWSREF